MVRNRRLAAGVIFATAGLVLACWAPASAAKPKKAARRLSIRIGLIASLFRETPEPVVQIIMQPFKTFMEKQTGVSSQLVNGGDAGTLARKLVEDDLQLGIFHGFEFAWARVKYPDLKPLLIAVNQQTFLRAQLVVRDDSPASGPGDLQGQVLALPMLSREHCRLFLERRCTRPGVAPAKHYGRVDNTLGNEQALDALVDGKVQAVVVDDVSLGFYRKDKPGRGAKIRVLLDSGPLPCAVVAYMPGKFSDDLVERFRTGMLNAKKSPLGRHMLEMSRITGFEKVPEDYDDLLTLVARDFPPPAE
jgi:ABC-type phosphate/phosphonate transport system substrate-binding protein